MVRTAQGTCDEVAVDSPRLAANLPAYERLTEPGDSRDERDVAIAADWIGGERHACGFGMEHPLDEDGDCVAACVTRIRVRPLARAAGPHATNGLLQLPGRHVEPRLVLTGE